MSWFIGGEWEAVSPWVMLGAMNLTPIKQDKEMNVYTKQMQEAGELPKVGMTVDFRKCDCEVMTGADAVGYFVIVYEGEWEVVKTSDITAIDARTDTEKAIDDIKKLLISVAEKSFDVKAQVILEKAIAGKIHSVTFTGDK